MLFRGHRELILGFNTFLPKVRSAAVAILAARAAGWRRSAHVRPQTGQTPRTGSRTLFPPRRSRLACASGPRRRRHPTPTTGAGGFVAPDAHGAFCRGTRFSSPTRKWSLRRVAHPAPSTRARAAKRSRRGAWRRVAPTCGRRARQRFRRLAILTSSRLGAQKQPVEFDQAISYVNKIKTRFQARPQPAQPAPRARARSTRRVRRGPRAVRGAPQFRRSRGLPSARRTTSACTRRFWRS